MLTLLVVLIIHNRKLQNLKTICIYVTKIYFLFLYYVILSFNLFFDLFDICLGNFLKKITEYINSKVKSIF